MSRRRRNPFHDDLMAGYYAAREAQEAEAEAYSGGYATELAEFYERNPRLTFRQWLIWNRRSINERMTA